MDNLNYIYLLQEREFVKCNENISSTTTLLNSDFPNIKKIIFLSTLDVYDNQKMIDETSLLNPISLYGHSKLYSENIVSIIANKKNIVHQILRIGHVYGPGEEAYEKIIPNTFRNLIKNESIQILGSGNEIRSFIYIEDVISAVMNSITLNKYVGPINIVSSNKITINDLVSKIMQISGLEVPILHLNADQSGRDLIFDNSKMRQKLNIIETPFTLGLINEWNYMKKTYS